VFSSLRGIASSVAGTDDPTQSDLSKLGEQLVGMRALSGFWEREADLDPETIGSMASIYKEIYGRTGDQADAHRSKDLYLRGFRATGAYWLGINAATMSLLQGDVGIARKLAGEVYSICTNSGDVDYWTLATIGEALLVLGNTDDSVRAYREAVRKTHPPSRNVVSSLAQLRLMERHGKEVPAELFEILKAPTVITFTGHMIDRPGAPHRFPPWLETSVRREIDAALLAMEPRQGHAIGYCSAACGGDILFAEALLDRGEEVNIVIPFDQGDFVATSVAYAGPAWVRRFDQALNAASSVTFATEERYLEDDVLFAFNAVVTNGKANLRADALLSQAQLLAVWDGEANDLIGGTAHTITNWRPTSTVTVVDLDRLLREADDGSISQDQPVEVPIPPKASSISKSGQECDRLLKTMLFADIEGFSSLREEDIPFYVYSFLDRVSGQLAVAGMMATTADGSQPFVNTWGDAIFAVMGDACSMVRYALALQAAVCDTDWSKLGFPGQMSIRIGLHAGPVYEGIDPITGRPNYYGSHVNRAARIEPVTVPGYIYASEQFVCTLTMEEVANRQVDGASEVDYACEPVGTIELAKDFGSQTLYLIRGRPCLK
jgi:class 3 adenylate cyclase